MTNFKSFIILTLLTLYLTAIHPSTGCCGRKAEPSPINQCSLETNRHSPYIEISTECPANILIGNCFSDLSQKSTCPFFNENACTSSILQFFFAETINSKDTSISTWRSCGEDGRANLGVIWQFRDSTCKWEKIENIQDINDNNGDTIGFIQLTQTTKIPFKYKFYQWGFWILSLLLIVLIIAGATLEKYKEFKDRTEFENMKNSLKK